jgi:serine protease inhibitor
MNSGDTASNTTIVGEYKNRSWLSVAEYPSSIIEVQKFESLKAASKLFDCPAFYVVEYSESCVVFQLDFTKEYKEDVMPLWTNAKKEEKKDKPVYHLDCINDSAIIVGKGIYSTGIWQRATKEQLQEYISRKSEAGTECQG